MSPKKTDLQNSNSAEEPSENTQENPYASLNYEQARDKLNSIVQELDSGNQSLEDSMKLWEQGQGLANHCEELLLGAQKQLDEAAQAQQEKE